MSIVFDRVADQYDASRGGTARGEHAAADLDPWFVPGPVLEVGVGTGLIAAALTARGHTVLGVDLSPAMLAKAAARLGTGRLALADACRLPVAPASVSTVVYVYALHAIGDVSAALAEAARVLRPGGRVVAMHGGGEDEANDVTRALAPLNPLRLARPDRDEVIVRAAELVGLTTVWQGEARPLMVPRTPREVADSIRRRLWSFLWDLDDTIWRERAEPAIAALEALPDPDRPREFEQRHRMSVLGSVS